VAVVVDEYGGVAGMLTVKDLLEPLVGDLHDEFDEEEEAMIVRVDNTRWLIDGQTNVDDVSDRLGIEIPDGEYVTLGGLLFDQFGHIPVEGEEIRVGDWNLRVIEMDKRRVAQVVATYAGEGDGPLRSAPENGGEGPEGAASGPKSPGESGD
jgi:CBS domain containing-hemolysin-like protein